MKQILLPITSECLDASWNISDWNLLRNRWIVQEDCRNIVDESRILLLEKLERRVVLFEQHPVTDWTKILKSYFLLFKPHIETDIAASFLITQNSTKLDGDENVVAIFCSSEQGTCYSITNLSAYKEYNKYSNPFSAETIVDTYDTWNVQYLHIIS